MNQETKRLLKKASEMAVELSLLLVRTMAVAWTCEMRDAAAALKKEVDKHLKEAE